MAVTAEQGIQAKHSSKAFYDVGPLAFGLHITVGTQGQQVGSSTAGVNGGRVHWMDLAEETRILAHGLHLAQVLPNVLTYTQCFEQFMHPGLHRHEALRSPCSHPLINRCSPMPCNVFFFLMAYLFVNGQRR